MRGKRFRGLKPMSEDAAEAFATLLAVSEEEKQKIQGYLNGYVDEEEQRQKFLERYQQVSLEPPPPVKKVPMSKQLPPETLYTDWIAVMGIDIRQLNTPNTLRLDITAEAFIAIALATGDINPQVFRKSRNSANRHYYASKRLVNVSAGSSNGRTFTVRLHHPRFCTIELTATTYDDQLITFDSVSKTIQTVEVPVMTLDAITAVAAELNDIKPPPSPPQPQKIERKKNQTKGRIER